LPFILFLLFYFFSYLFPFATIFLFFILYNKIENNGIFIFKLIHKIIDKTMIKQKKMLMIKSRADFRKKYKKRRIQRERSHASILRR